MRGREEYVRPPVVASEAPSPRLAVWRFRLIAAVLLAVVGLAFLLFLLKVANVTDEDPGFGVGLGAPSVSQAAAGR